MDIKKIIVSNLYMIGAIVIGSGFTWMALLAFVPDNLDELMVAFTFTVSGIIFWGVGYRYENQGKKQHLPKFLHSPSDKKRN